MQTFLPYSSYLLSSRALDSRRLQKQIVECQQILKVLLYPEQKAWKNHPAVLMWKGHELHLAVYAHQCYLEWVSRGYGPTHKSMTWIVDNLELIDDNSNLPPPWLGNKEFHNSHRSNLLRKSEYYNQYEEEWNVPKDIPYVWPTKVELG